MKRGEIWTVAGGVYASKPRPALIIQDDRFDATDSVTVVPMTTTMIDAPLMRLPVLATATTGLSQRSQLMVDKVTTVRRTAMRSRLGRLPAAMLVEVERALMVFLGLAD